MNKKRQIFIVGPPRSGTSLLAKSIADCIGGFIVTEVPLITYFGDYFSSGVRQGDFDALTQEFNKYYSIGALDFGVSYDFQGFYGAYINKWSGGDAEVVIDKNPFYAFQVRHILRLFPDALVLFICRDAMATVNSHLENQHKLGADICFHAHLWNMFIDEFKVLKKEYSRQINLVRYESFVQQNDQELDKILRFLDCERKGTAVNQPLIVGKDDQSEFVDGLMEKVASSPNSGRLLSWKDSLTEEQQLQISQITAKNRLFLGYTNESEARTGCVAGVFKAKSKVFLEKLIYYLPVRLKDFRLRMK